MAYVKLAYYEFGVLAAWDNIVLTVTTLQPKFRTAFDFSLCFM